jgi:Flp pilus assembly protein TadD
MSTIIPLTRSQKITAAKTESLTGEQKMALAAITGKKGDRAVAANDAMQVVTKLLTGQAAGGNRAGAVLVLRACMGLEQGCFDSAFDTFKGSLNDTASLSQWRKPFIAALTILAQREESARQIGVWAEASSRFEKERKALEKARDAKNAPKVAEKAAAFVDRITPLIERAEERLKAQKAPAEAQETA